VLEVEDLTVRYGAVTAVRGVSLRVADGEFVTVVGANGAGKSTLLRGIAGLVRPAGGRILLRGKPITGAAPERVVRAGLSLVPEGRHVFTTVTVAENLMLGRLARGRRADHSAALAEVFEYFPALVALRHRRASTLSGGEQQMLAIARAMLARPAVLLLDEPSLGLAPRVVDVVLESLVRLHERGTSILLVEQNAQRAVALADRVYVLHKGVLASDRVTGHDLAAAFFGDPGSAAAGTDREPT
jgi:branched-chain amino acid transport system ATP-binding protein